MEATLGCGKVIGSTESEDKENITRCSSILAQKNEERERNSELKIKAKTEPYRDWKVRGDGGDERVVPPMEEYTSSHGSASTTGGTTMGSGYRQPLDAIRTLPRCLLYS